MRGFYYSNLEGRNLYFSENEIESVKPASDGFVLTIKKGTQFKVQHQHPTFVEHERPRTLDPRFHYYKRS